MAGLKARPDAISAAQQFRAVAYLRWCLFRNGFRRKGGAGELVARIMIFPIAAGFVIGPMIAAGTSSFFAVRAGHLEYLLPIFWAIFALQILVSINVSPPGLSFDPESLIRFPVSFARYLTVRLVLGLLSGSTVIGTMALLASALGVTLAIPSVALTAFAATISLAITNMLFVRMIFAWVDRWLSTRRARELFTVFIILFSVGVQYVNVTFNGYGGHHNHANQMAKIKAVVAFYHRIQPGLALLPPGPAAASILHAHGQQAGLAALNIFGVLGFAAVFLAIFAWRMQREYRGENLSEVNHSATPVARLSQASRSAAPASLAPASLALTITPSKRSLISPQVLTALHKEFTYVRRNPAQLFGLIGPLAIVFLYAARFSTFGHAIFIFPGVVAYSLLLTAALAYNALGLDAAGVQFYFLMPVPIRTIFLAKNLFSFSINLLQLVLIYLLLAFTSGAPPVLIVLATLCWAIFAALVNVTIGNMRSITAPKKIDPSKMSRKQASQLSAFMAMGIMLVAGGVFAGVIALGSFAGMPWLPIPILLIFDFGALALYIAGLHRLDALMQTNRETLLEELTKVSV